MTKREGLIVSIFLFLLLICSTSSFAKMPQIDINDWVSISGDIDTGKADEVILALMNLDSKPGTAPIGIRITSPGGSLTAVMAICDVINSLRHPVV
ncbi:ATP-dependent Clp protease proteolytic subunit, partial [Candidatus Aerophobetes bacterium]|nr:ATP-dependent Clp protease proteolytic subunit [Candidatus Aerophobetes bacterium]